MSFGIDVSGKARFEPDTGVLQLSPLDSSAFIDVRRATTLKMYP
jgi:hypothetical protein